MTTIGTVELIAKIDTSQYKKGTKEIEKANKDIEGSADKTSSRIGKSFSTASQVATTAILAGAALITRTFIQSASEIQSLRASFESLTGNVEDTNAVMSTLYELSKQTAFENKDIQAAGRNYLAAGVEVGNLQEILKDTADIAGATGANLGQLTLPLTQTIARGKLQTQDFYQILNAGAGALRKPLTELAGKKGFGSLAEALEDGAITSQDLLDVMSNVTKEGGFAFEGAIKQSETFNGRISNLKESMTNLGLSILGVNAVTGEVDPDGAFSKMATAVTTLTNVLTENKEEIKTVATVIAILLIPAIVRLGVQGLLAGARIGAGILLALGPIGLLIALVGVLAYIVISNFDTIKNFVVDVWDRIKGAAEGAFNWVKENWPLILAIITGPFGLAVLAIVKNFDTIKRVVGDVWNWIKGVFGTIGSVASNIIKVPVNAIINFAENTLNNFIRAINGAISSINKIPGVDIGQLGTISVPRLATGGIVTSPTLAMIGEGRESEAIIPLSKLDSMLNGSTGSNVEVTINLSGVMARSRNDLRAIGKDLIESVNEELRAKQMPEIGGGAIRSTVV